MSPLWWTRVILLGMHGEDVRAVQQLVGLPQTGQYDLDTASTVRGLQLMFPELEPTGQVDEATATRMGPRAQDSLLPDWYAGKPLSPGSPDYDLVVSGFGGEAGVRRLQGQYGMAPTGVIDQQMALILSALGALV